jgi:uncharacterized membrane protein YoaK (UPF0700 family)
MSEPDRPPQPLIVALAALTAVSGIVDAVSYLGLGRVFTANMTGNVLLIGFGIAGAPGFSIAASACALGLFLVGAVVGGRLARSIRDHRSLLLTAVVLESGFTAVAAAIAGSVAVLDAGWPRLTVIALLSFPMGIRNSVVKRLGVPAMTTTVLTTTLTGMASDSWLAGGKDPHARNALISLFSLFAGALVGAALEVHLHPGWALALATVILVATAGYFAFETPVALGTAQ